MIADYMFNKFTVPAGHRLCVMLTSGPMSAGSLDGLAGKTLADLRALGSVLATAVPNVDVGSFGFRAQRSQTSAYGLKYVPAFSLPSMCSYSPMRTGTCTYVVLALLDGSTETAKVVRCYQCTAGVAAAEALLTRVTISVEDGVFNSKLAFSGTPGQQVGAQERTLRSVAIATPVTLPDASESTLSIAAKALTPIATALEVVETVKPNAASIGNL